MFASFGMKNLALPWAGSYIYEIFAWNENVVSPKKKEISVFQGNKKSAS